MKINYIAPIGQMSGYGEFARNVISGLCESGADVKIQPLQFAGTSQAETDLVNSWVGGRFKDLIGRHLKPTVNIINIIPPLFKANKQPGVLNVGFTMFETDRIPASWVESCNAMDAVLVPCSHNRDFFKRSGVEVPPYCVPPAIDFKPFDGRVRPPRAQRSIENPFVFYSIFQWSDRKNPAGLLRAYWATFTGRDDVVLRLKLYVQNPAELVAINAEIATLKKSARLRHYPKVEIISDMMTQQQMIDFHLAGDCFVSASHGEGLGLCLIEAMALETPVISTAYSGPADFLDGRLMSILDPETRNALIVRHTKSPAMCSGPNGHFYEANMMWGEPDLEHLMECMWLAKNDSHLCAAIAKRAAQDVRRKYDAKTCTDYMLGTLQSLIEKK